MPSLQSNSTSLLSQARMKKVPTVVVGLFANSFSKFITASRVLIEKKILTHRFSTHDVLLCQDALLRPGPQPCV